MIGHGTRLRENDDLSLLRAPATNKKPPFLNVLGTREFVRSKRGGAVRRVDFIPNGIKCFC